MKYLSIVFDITILLLGTKFTISRYKYKKRMDIFIATNIIICLYYAFIPLLIKVYNFEYNSNYMKTLYTTDGSQYFFVSFFCLLLYLVFLFVNTISKTSEAVLLNEDAMASKDKYIQILNARNYRTYTLFAYLCFVIGSISFFTIAYSVGGVEDLIKIGDLSRGYGKDLSNYISSRLLPLRTIMVVILASPFLFYVMENHKRSLMNLVMLLSSTAISILFLVFNAGRAPLITFVLPFILLILLNRFKRPWISIVIVSILLIPILKWLDNLFFYISYGVTKAITNDTNIICYFIEQFGYPYVNMLNANKMINYFGLRLGVDYITWGVNIIPVSILSKLGLWKVSIITDYITAYYGQATYTSKMLGGIPIDVFTLGYLQLKLLGAAFFICIFGLIVRYIDNLCYRDRAYKLNQVLYLRIALTFIFLIPNTSFESIVRGRSDIIILILVIILTSKIKIKKYKSMDINNEHAG